jgi:hypothetical protein
MEFGTDGYLASQLNVPQVIKLVDIVVGRTANSDKLWKYRRDVTGEAR